MQHIVQHDGEQLFTTSEIIAERAGIEHRAVLQLITNFGDDLSEFGTIAFEMRKSGGRPTRFAKLNEQQSTLLLTYLRNTEIVRQFKKDLVKGFYEMAQELQGPQLDELEVAERYVAELRRNRELTPKAEAYDSFIDADGTYSVGTVAKMLGLSQNKLFHHLRNHGVLIGKGPMRNTPYQQYMHHFSVKAYTYTRSEGSEGTSYTTRVQSSGVDFIRRKLRIEKQVAA